MEFCGEYSERVRGVLLAATICRAEAQEGKQQRAAMADRLLREGMGPYAEEVLPKMVTPANLAALPKVAEHVRTMMRSTNRSEEHTSELQSPDHLVCPLLLEKKNPTPIHTPRS